MPETDHQALERFVLDNEDLLNLEQMLGRFNVFDALGVARAEVRHSHFLAWLLTPGESHGHGDLFLRAVLMDLLRQMPAESRPLSPLLLDGSDLSDVEVRREWRRIDLLITSRDPTPHPFVIAIENKVGAGEHGDQLARYCETVQREFPPTSGVRAAYVFLTPAGTAASDDRWTTYTYADLHRVLTRVKATNAISGEVGVFLDHYLTLVGSRMMDDPTIAELCRRIYRNHRQALDLIIEHMDTPQTELLAEVERGLTSQPEFAGLLVTRRTGSYITCAPREWPGLLPPICTDRADRPWEWLSFTITVYARESVYLELYIGPTSDPLPRERLLNAFRERPELGLSHRAPDRLRLNARRTLWSRRVHAWKENEELDVPAAVRATLTAIASPETRTRLEATTAVLRELFGTKA
jgi:hypothetical protein